MKKKNRFFDFVAALAFEFDVDWETPYPNDGFGYEVVDEPVPKKSADSGLGADLAG